KGGAEEDGEDIFHEAMVVLFEKVQNADFRLSCKIGTYLIAVGKNLWYKKIEHQNRNPVYHKEDISDLNYSTSKTDVDIQVEREAHYNTLTKAMDKLGHPCADILKAFYHEAKSMHDIAQQFGYTNTDNAKTQKFKCLQRLKKLFYAEQVED